MAHKFEQLSPLMDDALMMVEIVKAIASARGPLDTSQVLIQLHGELLQLTFEYIEQIGRITEAAMRLSTKHVR